MNSLEQKFDAFITSTNKKFDQLNERFEVMANQVQQIHGSAKTLTPQQIQNSAQASQQFDF
jgi:hypothetical protein